jgi:hypothetical protein
MRRIKTHSNAVWQKIDERHDHRDQAVMRCGGQELRQLVCMTMNADENGMANSNSNASQMKWNELKWNEWYGWCDIKQRLSVDVTQQFGFWKWIFKYHSDFSWNIESPAMWFWISQIVNIQLIHINFDSGKYLKEKWFAFGQVRLKKRNDGWTQRSMCSKVEMYLPQWAELVYASYFPVIGNRKSMTIMWNMCMMWMTWSAEMKTSHSNAVRNPCNRQAEVKEEESHSETRAGNE